MSSLCESRLQEGTHQEGTPNPAPLICGQGRVSGCPDLTFTPLFYLLREGTSGSRPGKQAPSLIAPAPQEKEKYFTDKR